MVPFGKSSEEKAEQDLNKAERLFDAIQYKKAGKYFNSAGSSFYEIDDFSSAEISFLKAAQSYIKDERYVDALTSLRNASNASLKLQKYAYAQEVVQKALQYTKKLPNGKEKSNFYILFSSLHYLCALVKGEPEKGLNLIKKVQKSIDKEYFKEHSLIHFITNITITLRDQKESYIQKIVDSFSKIDLTPVENELSQIVICIVYIQTSIIPKVDLDKEQWTIKDLIGLELHIDEDLISFLMENPYYTFPIETLEITKFTIKYSDNLTINESPNLPLEITKDTPLEFPFLLKPQFQKDNSYIGPFQIEGKINDTYMFYLQNREEIKLKLVSPPTRLDISIKSLKPPLLEQTFPLEIVIENNSESEARNLDIKITLPDNLQLIRGTLEKQIYSLGTNESIDWKINAKPLEVGEYEIIGEITYNDPDLNILEEKEGFPISIKM